MLFYSLTDSSNVWKKQRWVKKEEVETVNKKQETEQEMKV